MRASYRGMHAGGLVGRLLAIVVKCLHVLLVGFVLCAPFCSDMRLVAMHLVLAAFLLCHWQFRNDTCALTLLEAWLRGVPAGESFMHTLVGPVYNITETALSGVVRGVTLGLLLVSAWRLRSVGWEPYRAAWMEVSHRLGRGQASGDGPGRKIMFT